MTDSKQRRILVIDDDEDTREVLQDLLELDGYFVASAPTAAEALRIATANEQFAILLDRRLPDGNAEELLPRLKEVAPAAAIIIVTGYADLGGALQALRLGTDDYIIKPVNPEALRASLRRIASRQEAEEALRESDARFRSAFDHAPIGMALVALDGRLLQVNRSLAACLGYAQDELVDRELVALTAPEDAAAVESALVGFSHGEGERRRMQCRMLDRRGQVVWTLFNASLVLDAANRPSYCVVQIQDITPQRRAEQQLLQSARLAAIGEMVTGLAHESRNALQRSQASLERLSLRLHGQTESLDLVARIQNAQDHLHRLYEEVRHYAAPIQLDYRRERPDELLDRVWEDLDGHWRGRTASLRHDRTAVGGVVPELDVDRHRLQQVFRNVVENSLTAGADPLVIQATWSRGSIGGRPALEIRLRDNGPGLPTPVAERIFEPFFTTKTQGTGLGMAIARRIVETHSGTIDVGETGHVGAEIVIRMPLEKE
ncbi:Sensor histidine kinase TmoS [Planctomycetes bacterium Pan216]|uniref:histidine kinase n=1 Tax=Kolteria novifilia TaxID=2527975 RepID=A0A518B1K1_9BACT|nr:Sensor histidine kinase TmoS [Planctomycetes bacterium Pan216]